MSTDEIRGVCEVCGETVTLDPEYASLWRHDEPGALHGAHVVRGADDPTPADTETGESSSENGVCLECYPLAPPPMAGVSWCPHRGWHTETDPLQSVLSVLDRTSGTTDPTNRKENQ